MSDTRLPHLDLHAAARKLNAYADSRAVVAQDGGDRQVVEIRVRMQRALVAFGVDGLGEIALAVEQANADKGQAHVARRLAVVAGQDAQAPGIDRQALVEAEFGAEIGDQIALMRSRLRSIAPQGCIEINVEGRQHPVIVAEENRVVGGVDQFLRGRPA